MDPELKQFIVDQCMEKQASIRQRRKDLIKAERDRHYPALREKQPGVKLPGDPLTDREKKGINVSTGIVGGLGALTGGVLGYGPLKKSKQGVAGTLVGGAMGALIGRVGARGLAGQRRYENELKLSLGPEAYKRLKELEYRQR